MKSEPQQHNLRVDDPPLLSFDDRSVSEKQQQQNFKVYKLLIVCNQQLIDCSPLIMGGEQSEHV